MSTPICILFFITFGLCYPALLQKRTRGWLMLLCWFAPVVGFMFWWCAR